MFPVLNVGLRSNNASCVTVTAFCAPSSAAAAQLDDLEGAYIAPALLRELKEYMPVYMLPRASLLAARCNYVNFPTPPLADPLNRPMCEQGWRLKQCLIVEAPVPQMTVENKIQLEEMLVDWLWMCSLEEFTDLARLLAYMRRPTGSPEPEFGCALKCLFQDMGWIDFDPNGERLLLNDVVIEMIKLYYNNNDSLPQIIEGGTSCIEGYYKYPI